MDGWYGHTTSPNSVHLFFLINFHWQEVVNYKAASSLNAIPDEDKFKGKQSQKVTSGGRSAQETWRELTSFGKTFGLLTTVV